MTKAINCACAGVLFGMAAATLSPAAAQDMRAALNTESAKTIIAGCEAFAEENDLRISIAVLDQGRNLMAFLRMDGASLGSTEIASWKANSSASFRAATKGVNERAQDFPAFGHAPNVAIFEGAEAIFTANGDPLGGVGVSGAASADDAACARAGIAAAGLRHERPGD